MASPAVQVNVEDDHVSPQPEVVTLLISIQASQTIHHFTHQGKKILSVQINYG